MHFVVPHLSRKIQRQVADTLLHNDPEERSSSVKSSYKNSDMSSIVTVVKCDKLKFDRNLIIFLVRRFCSRHAYCCLAESWCFAEQDFVSTALVAITSRVSR
jgi:hypothetical protein